MRDTSFAIRLTNISKRYTIHHEKPTLVEKFIKEKNEEFWVYPEKCETFILGTQKHQPYHKKGERVGIISLNLTGLWVNHPGFVNFDFKYSGSIQNKI